MCNFLSSPVTSHSLGLDILPIITFSDIFSLRGMFLPQGDRPSFAPVQNLQKSGHCITYSALYEGDVLCVGIAAGYGLDDRGSILGGKWEFFSSTPRPDLLWGPSNGYRGLFPQG